MKKKRQQITLDLPLGIFEILKAKAAKAGKSLEEFVSDILSQGVIQALEKALIEKGGN